MAINVNNVYQTVLLILNKEQRGYITPDEFNKTATQVQLDIFEQYFEDINQQLRIPQADVDYADRQMAIDEKISIFKARGECDRFGTYFSLPDEDEITGHSVVYNDSTGVNDEDQMSFYKLGVVTYEPSGSDKVELQRLSRAEFYNIENSPLTKATTSYPTYFYEAGRLYINPTTITQDITANFIRKPKPVNWAYSVGSLGQYTFDLGNSQNFELSLSEQTRVVLKILLYSGIVIRDPQVVQVAANEVAQNEANQKS